MIQNIERLCLFEIQSNERGKKFYCSVLIIHRPHLEFDLGFQFSLFLPCSQCLTRLLKREQTKDIFICLPYSEIKELNLNVRAAKFYCLDF